MRTFHVQFDVMSGRFTSITPRESKPYETTLGFKDFALRVRDIRLSIDHTGTGMNTLTVTGLITSNSIQSQATLLEARGHQGSANELGLLFANKPLWLWQKLKRRRLLRKQWSPEQFLA